MRLIAALLPPTGGAIRWNGRDIRKHPDAMRRTLGYLAQDYGVYPELTPRQFLRYLAALKGLRGALAQRRVDEVLDQVSLEREADRTLSGFSGGMKQRVGHCAG